MLIDYLRCCQPYKLDLHHNQNHQLPQAALLRDLQCQSPEADDVLQFASSNQHLAIPMMPMEMRLRPKPLLTMMTVTSP